MARHKDKEFKDFQISERRKTSSGLTNAPVWIMQKAGKRIWNVKQKRTWKTIDLADLFHRHVRRKGKVLTRSGDHKNAIKRKKREN